MRKQRQRIKPSFLVVVASATIACSSPTGGNVDTPDGGTSTPPPSGSVSNNPPPPERLARPNFGEMVSLADAPPTLGAATLIVTPSGAAVGTDPDRDRVMVVDVDAGAVREVPLTKGDEPGRVVADGEALVHVVLQRAGAIASIDVATGEVRERRSVCPAPRGIARTSDALFVACAGGELVSLPRVGGEATLVARLDPDLRDVVGDGADRMLISRLRSAEILLVGRDGTVLGRTKPAAPADRTAFVAWRLAAKEGPAGPVGAIAAHQLAQEAPIATDMPRAYASTNPCNGVVTNAVTSFGFDVNAVPAGPTIFAEAVLPVDVATSATGDIAVVAAGNGHTRELAQVHLRSWSRDLPGCVAQPSTTSNGEVGRRPNVDPPGQAVAVAFRSNGELLVLSREPAAIHAVDPSTRTPSSISLPWKTIPLGGASREDTGHAIFQSNAGGGIACASCHPTGADDGHVWTFADGARRTQSLQGTLASTAPYHWAGDVPNVARFGDAIFTRQMAGQALTEPQLQALEAYLLHIPRVAPSVADEESVARGKAIFERGSVGCATCHSGPALTNNTTTDVGTGGAFQVPSLLGVALHAPYFHDGRAATLGAPFGPSAGVLHGDTTTLTEAERSDLIAYVLSL